MSKETQSRIVMMPCSLHYRHSLKSNIQKNSSKIDEYKVRILTCKALLQGSNAEYEYICGRAKLWSMMFKNRNAGGDSGLRQKTMEVVKWTL